jgi:hypothetical protein
MPDHGQSAPGGDRIAGLPDVGRDSGDPRSTTHRRGDRGGDGSGRISTNSTERVVAEQPTAVDGHPPVTIVRTSSNAGNGPRFGSAM